MKRFFLFPVFLLTCSILNATNYYVDVVNGNNGNSGLNPGLAFKSIPTAAALTNPGDTVFIMNGVYASFTISRPGAEGGRIVYTNFPGHSPQVVSTSTTYNTITVGAGANYITINGLDIIGYGVSLSLSDTTEAQAALDCPTGAPPARSILYQSLMALVSTSAIRLRLLRTM